MANEGVSDQAAAWVVDAVRPGAELVSAKPLRGGISSRVHRVTLRVDGKEKEYVLRQIDDEAWLRIQPDVAAQEAANLRRASAASAVPTPALVAFDGDGSRCGNPAVLMTRLEGEVVLEPYDRSRWLDGLAGALAAVHRIPWDDHPWGYAPYCDAATLDTTAWSTAPDDWRAAASFVAGHRPAAPRRFIHRDYHPANVLWKDGSVSGVVDWVNGCVGPAGIDVGHCRVNLALLHDVETADDFLSRYRREAGADFEYDPYWDLVSLIDFAYGPPPEVYGGWTALGVTRLTDASVREGLDTYVSSLLARIGDRRA